MDLFHFNYIFTMNGHMLEVFHFLKSEVKLYINYNKILAIIKHCSTELVILLLVYVNSSLKQQILHNL